MPDIETAIPGVPTGPGQGEAGSIPGYQPKETLAPAAVDYFDFDETERVTLPDGTSWVAIRKLNEGDRIKYQNAINKDVTVNSNTKDAKIRTAPGTDRKILLEEAICDWNLQRGGVSVPFSQKACTEFLNKTDPRIIDLIEKAVRKSNSWLLADMTVEEIDKEIADLQELRETVEKEEAAKNS